MDELIQNVKELSTTLAGMPKLGIFKEAVRLV